MKTDTNILKLILLFLAIAMSFELFSCKKDAPGPEMIPALNAKYDGTRHNVKSNVFNAGVFQPENGGVIKSVYFNYVTYTPYVHYMAAAKWTGFKGGNSGSYAVGDTTTLDWQMPLEDLQ